ncbi:tripartite tricarboxylate transporter substrate binding protein [Pseudoroseomonas wenyumeiae]|uniref:Tripartite tricarboxylate transporter substrate binding protein n=2 Tax=Teichococcus wenyumeiae TaxID=2478470 RepID=A0A3A9JFB6_9PROT|nr:tripartite tricarboxylate transporter substrate binding protein [Pseudoroseomonas wenyumeiae]RMI17486.1 tripartite tricarboxylate transporter substrate binding protein [Pseudoroseomonas wenyumeiae]
MNRRHVLQSALALPTMAYTISGPPAQAEPLYPALRLFIPANPGGGWDGLGRAIEHVVRQAGLAGGVQVENVGGAGGTVGLPRFLAQYRNRPEGLMVAGSVMVGAAIANKSPAGVLDVAPVARLTEEVSVFVVPPDSPLKTIQDLLARLKENPGAVSVAGGSAGGTEHITLGLMLKALGRSAREASYVAYSGGGPAQAAVLGGQVVAAISGISEFGEQVRAGRLRALATTGERRAGPDVPTLKEIGLNVALPTWRGVFCAPSLTVPQKAALVTLMERMRDTPEWREVLSQRGWDDAWLPGEAFGRFLEKEVASTAAVLTEIGLA